MIMVHCTSQEELFLSCVLHSPHPHTYALMHTPVMFWPNLDWGMTMVRELLCSSGYCSHLQALSSNLEKVPKKMYLAMSCHWSEFLKVLQYCQLPFKLIQEPQLKYLYLNLYLYLNVGLPGQEYVHCVLLLRYSFFVGKKLLLFGSQAP